MWCDEQRDRVPEARQHVQPRDRRADHAAGDAAGAGVRGVGRRRLDRRRGRAVEARSGARVMSTLEIRDLHAVGRRQGDPQRHRPHRHLGRGARRDGPERRRQEHALRRRDGQARLRGARPARSRSTASTCSRCRPGSGRVAGLHLVMQYPTEVPGVTLDDVLTEALAQPRPLDRRARRARSRAEAEPDRLRRTVPRPRPQRRPLRRREEAQRDAAARGARARGSRSSTSSTPVSTSTRCATAPGGSRR